MNYACLYNYLLGGKDNFEVDRESGAALEMMFPTIRTAAIENRKFLGRAVTLLTDQLGVRQFLEIGTGLPCADNTHEVAQRIAPESKVVYVDSDPLVMVYARALLTPRHGAGRIGYIQADVREPAPILHEAAQTLDFSQPVALMLVAILHFLSDEDDPFSIVARLVEALPSGSCLVMSHLTGAYLTEQVIAQAARGAAPVWFRDREQFARFFEGLELLPPGIVSTAQWRAEDEPLPRPSEADIATYAAVASVP